MEFAFTEEQVALRDTARGFLAEHVDSAAVRAAMESGLGMDPQLWKRLGADLGWTSLLIPEAFGGSDLGFVDLVALLEVTGGFLLPAPLLTTVGLGANTLLVAGSEAQQQEHLPRIAAGECIATLAVTEPGGGWTPADLHTIVRRDGDGLILSGTKRHVLDGHCADLLVVAARGEDAKDERGLELILVPGDAEGLTRRALPGMDQTRRFAEIELRDVRVPAAARLAGGDADAAGLRHILDRASIALAAEQVGGAQRCLDMAVAYAKEREQFGRPIGSFQALKHKCADLMVAVESARSAVYYAACVVDEDDDELSVLASLAKATASETYFRCAADSLQIHGGVGFTWEYDVHLHLKRARSMEGFLGTPSRHRERVADHVLGEWSG